MVDREGSPDAFRRWLRAEFEARGWSQSHVARLAGDMTVSTIDRVLTGGELADWEFIASMAKILDEDLRFVAWKAGRWDSPPDRGDWHPDRGDRLPDREDRPSERGDRSPAQLSHAEDLLEIYDQLTPEHRELARLMVRTLLVHQAQGDEPETHRLTAEEIRRLDGGRFTLGSAALRDTVSRALAKVPAEVVVELVERCVILMPAPTDESAFLPADLVRERDVIPVSGDLLALASAEAEEEILRKVAHYWLGHRGTLSPGQAREASELVARWQAEAAGLPAPRDRDAGQG